MPESFDTKRIRFSSIDTQKEFMCSVKECSGVTWKVLAEEVGVSVRTLTDWARGKFLITRVGYEKLVKASGVRAAHVTDVDITERLSDAGKKGGHTTMQRYGQLCDEGYRKQRWQEWWKSEGRFSERNTAILQPMEITIPEVSIDLAEFIGIMIGDGSIATYHISISLDSDVDRLYADYVVDLVSSLFGCDPKIYFRKNSRSLDIVVQRVGIISFLRECGLPQGDKIRQSIDIPEWVKNSRELSRACVRGLIDTDGSLFCHSYMSAGKRYSYPKMSFTSRSPSLIQSVQRILQAEGFYARITASCDEIRVEKRADVAGYFSRIGTSNPKNIEKRKQMNI